MTRWPLGIVAMLVLSACAPAAGPPRTDWPMFQGGPTHNAIVRGNFPAVRWDDNLHSKINGGLAYDGYNLYAVDFAHALLAIDPRTGYVRWRARGDDVLMSTPIVGGGLVFVGSGTNRVLWDRPDSTVWGRPEGNRWFAFSARTGRLVWSYHTVGEAMPSAAYTGGTLIFATGSNHATALQASTGLRLWRRRIPGVATMGSAMTDGRRVFFVATKGVALYQSPTRNHTVALRVRDGSRMWSAPFGNSDCTPTLAQGLLFVEGVQDGPPGLHSALGTNDVTALDGATGRVVWHYRSRPGYFTGVATNMRGIPGTYHAGVLYQPIEARSEVIAFRARDGRIVWRLHTAAPVKMSPVIYRGKVYFGDTAGIFYVVDARTGSVRGVLENSKPFTSSPPLIVGKTLFIANASGLRAVPVGTL